MKLANRLLIANRGEIAIRIARTAGQLGIQTIAIHAEDDANSLHVRQADDVCPLKGVGTPAHLDQAQIIETAKSNGCDAIHPGYGFLSENADFAARCRDENIIFVGPRADTLRLLGDKIQARNIAKDAKIPVLPATEGGTSLDAAKSFYRSLGENGAMMLKAVAGGGGGRAGGGSRAASAPASSKGGKKAEGPAPEPVPGVDFIPSGTNGMKCDSFTWMAKLCSRVPIVGITAGICFAGNAVLLSLCDVIIAAANSNIGIGGPAMIEGGGLGVYRPDEIGPMGLEGQVKLGSIATLQAIEDPEERQATYGKLVARLYELGKGIWAAHGFEVDEMIDPADTRKWIIACLKAQPPSKRLEKPKGLCVDAW